MDLDSLFNMQQLEYVAGSIQDVRVEQFDYGESIVVEVLPIGETTPVPLFFSVPKPGRGAARSKWAKFLRDLGEIGVPVSKREDLVGLILKFKIEENEYKIDGETRVSEYWKPVTRYTSEAQAIEDLGLAVEGGTAAPVQEVAIPADVVEQAKTVYNTLGKNDDMFKQVAATTWSVDVDKLLEAVKA